MLMNLFVKFILLLVTEGYVLIWSFFSQLTDRLDGLTGLYPAVRIWW